MRKNPYQNTFNLNNRTKIFSSEKSNSLVKISFFKGNPARLEKLEKSEDPAGGK